MPIFAESFNFKPESIAFYGKLKKVKFSELSYFELKSGKHDPSKYDFRGYVPKGAVAPKYNNKTGDFIGLPIPERLILDSDALNSWYIKGKDADQFYYALCFDRTQNPGVIVAIPVKNVGSLHLYKKTDIESFKLRFYAGEEIFHSLYINKLVIWNQKCSLRKETKHTHGGAFIPVPQSFHCSMDRRANAIDRFDVFVDVKEIESENLPDDILEDPYYSVFYDNDGVILFFPVIPDLPSYIPAPEGIIRNKGFRWVRDIQKKSLSSWNSEDACVKRKPVDVEGRPIYPDTMAEWLKDR